MNKILSLTLLVIGIALIVQGVIAMDSFSADLSRVITGSPNDKAAWILIVGVIATVTGLSGISYASLMLNDSMAREDIRSVTSSNEQSSSVSE